MDNKEYLSKQLLRIATSGSVDDGKSTLIGRLLYDSKNIYEDKLEKIKSTSEKQGLDEVNLALLTDGLKDEVEQGITIDVAYHYFSTPKRKFIIADTPGHIQYTRNMVTGASTANLLLTLVDARQGILEQTKRHAFIGSLLQVPHLVICVNKMDLVDYAEEAYNKIMSEFEEFVPRLDIPDIRFIPISALKGDNVVNKSTNMNWYDGPTLMYLLETINISTDHNHMDCRFPVQTVLRPHTKEHHDYRGYAGRIASGVFKPGDEVVALPSGLTSHIKSIDTANRELTEAFAPQSVAITLNDDLDLGRGDMLVRPNNQPTVGQDIDLRICWMDEDSLDPAKKYIVRHTTNEARCVVKDIVYKVNINTYHRIEDDKNITKNDIARIKIRTTKPLLYDSYSRNRATGSLILVDEFTNRTVAAGMIV